MVTKETADLKIGSGGVSPVGDPAIVYLETGEDGVLVDRTNGIIADRSTAESRRGRPPAAKVETSQDRQRKARNVPARKPWPRTRFNHGHLADLAARFAATGLDEHAADARAALDAIANLNADTKAATAALARRRAELADAIAAGDTTPIAAAADLGDAARLADAGTAARLAEEARHRLLRDAGRRIYDLGDDLTHELDAVVADATANAAAAAAAARTINDDADAARADAKAHAAWQTLHQSAETIDACHALADRLRFRGLVPGLPPPAVPAEYWKWRNVDAVHATDTKYLHRNWRLVALIDADAQPAVLTAAELVELYL